MRSPCPTTKRKEAAPLSPEHKETGGEARKFIVIHEKGAVEIRTGVDGGERRGKEERVQKRRKTFSLQAIPKPFEFSALGGRHRMGGKYQGRPYAKPMGDIYIRKKHAKSEKMGERPSSGLRERLNRPQRKVPLPSHRPRTRKGCLSMEKDRQFD